MKTICCIITISLCFFSNIAQAYDERTGQHYTTFSDSEIPDDYVPCERGWYFFRNKCYRAEGRTESERLTWNRASDRCKSYGAELASIQSQEEQDFIVAYLQLDVNWWTWIGLNDRDKEGDFRWTDGSVFNYSNWDSNNPSAIDYLGQQEDCVHMVFNPEPLGQWNDRFCGATDAYVCEKNANPKESSPNPMYCSLEEGGGWKYENSCYHVVTEMKSWDDAENYCQNNYNGHLLTIHDKMEDFFLELAMPDIRKEMWIGIKMQNQLQQKWTSGWYVSYDGFNRYEKIFIDGTCVARKDRAEWVTIPCSRQLPFICEVSKASPPVLKPPPIGAHCPIELDDWRDLGGDHCYYIELKKSVNFHTANLHCNRRGGDLVSLHSQEEFDILQPFVIYQTFHVFIGLHSQMRNNEETFEWTDGSEFDYQSWGHNEPDIGDKKCVEIVTTTMTWQSASCENRYINYICSVKKVVPDLTPVNETANSTNTGELEEDISTYDILNDPTSESLQTDKLEALGYTDYEKTTYIPEEQSTSSNFSGTEQTTQFYEFYWESSSLPEDLYKQHETEELEVISQMATVSTLKEQATSSDFFGEEHHNSTLPVDQALGQATEINVQNKPHQFSELFRSRTTPKNTATTSLSSRYEEHLIVESKRRMEYEKKRFEREEVEHNLRIELQYKENNLKAKLLLKEIEVQQKKIDVQNRILQILDSNPEKLNLNFK